MPAIWKSPATVEDLNARSKGTIMDTLGITFTEIGDDFLTATMPVDHRTIQPMGLLHGGASVVLAETLGSVAATLCVDTEKQFCVGVAINANHVRAVCEGHVRGTTRPVQVGLTMQVWKIDIHDADGNLVAVSRLTLSVLRRLPQATS